jgi:hypothetical protein
MLAEHLDAREGDILLELAATRRGCADAACGDAFGCAVWVWVWAGRGRGARGSGNEMWFESSRAWWWADVGSMGAGMCVGSMSVFLRGARGAES